MTSKMVECACGCGSLIRRIDRKGRPRRFVSGHNTRLREKKNLRPTKHSEEHKRKMSKRMSGVNNPQYKKERFIDERGYALVLCPDHPNKKHRNYVYEHRFVMEQYLGRYLDSKEIVHHINGKPSDNRIENLKLLQSHAEHRKIHVSEANS